MKVFLEGHPGFLYQRSSKCPPLAAQETVWQCLRCKVIVQLCSLCICWIPGVLGKGKFIQDLETARRPSKAARGKSNRTKLLTIKVILPNRTSGQMHVHPWSQSPQVIWKSFWLNKQYEGEKIRLGGLLLAYIWNSDSFIHVNPLQILAVLCPL